MHMLCIQPTAKESKLGNKHTV